MKKEVKKANYWEASFSDVALTKLSVFFFTLFLVWIFPNFFSSFEDFRWWALVIALLLAIKPMRSFFRK